MNLKLKFTRALLLPTLLVAFSVGMTATPTWAAKGDITTVVGASLTPTAEDARNGNYGGFSGDGGAAKKAQLKYPTAMAIDGADDLFIADTQNNRIRKVEMKTGVISTVAGTGAGADQTVRGSQFGGDGGPARKAKIDNPGGLTFDSKGNLYFADSYNNRIRKIELVGAPMKAKK